MAEPSLATPPPGNAPTLVVYNPAMFSAWSLFLLALACLGLLFIVAWAGERRPLTRDHPRLRGVLTSEE